MPSQKPSKREGVLNKIQTPARRGSKPQVEKKRRARINKSLSELQALVIDEEITKNALKNRIEKADILEKTVAHIKSMREKQNPTNESPADSPSFDNGYPVHHSPLKKFNSGYMECVKNASRYLLEVEKVDQDLHDRLKSHLMLTYEEINIQAVNLSPSISPSTLNDEDSSESSSSQGAKSSSESDGFERLKAPSSPQPSISYVGFTPESNNQVVQVIPGRLPNGQLAFLLPHEDIEKFPKWTERDLAFQSEMYNQSQSNYSMPPPSHFGLNSYHEAAERQQQFLMMNSPDPRFPFQRSAASYMGRPNFNYNLHWRPW